jgi:hypothetical protein
VDRQSLDPEKGVREKFRNNRNHPSSGGQVAIDMGCSWNQTPEDLQVVEEKTHKREVREIIWTIHPEG